LILPRATEQARIVDIAGEHVRLVVRRSVRRSLALSVDHRGARLAVPHATSEAAIERFLEAHGAWLLERLGACVLPEPLPLVDGAVFPLLGAPARVRAGAGGGGATWRCAADGMEELCLPAAVDEALILDALKSRALTWFRPRVEEHCRLLALAAPPVRLSSARTRWGSCSRVSGIRLHWRLIHLQPLLIDYVVAHEVAHLLEMNHSPRFWKVVGQLCPGWRLARRQLRDAAANLPVIDGGDAFSRDHED
jgi:predicted metal-dependent hydrolase